MTATEEELEAQLREIQARLEAVRAANREAVLADVKAKIRKYAITRSELASVLPAAPRASAAAPILNADGTPRKKRGRKSKAEIEAMKAAAAGQPG
ncbi:MAG: hypothetical protein ACK4S2_13620 [Gemmobacter sp.]|uniref:hypothetical protein n=1 Tax=Gemmobacter sp. TaxID=1898957 RepID=UPI00391CD728